jgi:hypothetical protein
MFDSALTPFWIVPPGDYGPLGYGVTAFSLDHALRIIEDAGYDPPVERNTLRIIKGIKVNDLDHSHVVCNMGPIVVRGIWYPLVKVGL